MLLLLLFLLLSLLLFLRYLGLCREASAVPGSYLCVSFLQKSICRFLFSYVIVCGVSLYQVGSNLFLSKKFMFVTQRILF